MSCVPHYVKNSAAFKEAAEKLNISDNALENLVHRYINQDNYAQLIEEGKAFPSEPWLQEHLYAPASIVSDTSIVGLYEKNFQHPIVTNTYAEAMQVASEFPKWVDKNSVKVIETRNDKYQILVTKPILQKVENSYTRNYLLKVLHTIVENTVDNKVTDFTIKLTRSNNARGFNHFYIFKPINYNKTDAEFITEAENYLKQVLPKSVAFENYKLGIEVKELINGREGITVTPVNYKLPKVENSITEKSTTSIYNNTEKLYIESVLKYFPGLREAYKRGELNLTDIDFTNPDWMENLVNYYNESYSRNTVSNSRQEQAALSEIEDFNLKTKAEQFFPESSDFVSFVQKLNNENSYISEFLNHIIQGYTKAGIKIQIVYDDSIPTVANVTLKNKVAKVNINRARYLASMLMEVSTSNKAQRILLHELIHPLTTDAAIAHPTILKYFGARTEDVTFNKEINELYNIALNAIEGDWYGLSNVQEFIAELMTNQDFQLELAKVPYNSNTSIFNKFIQVLHKLFKNLGFNISDTLLERSLQVTHNYTQFVIDNGEFSFLSTSNSFEDSKSKNQEFFEQQTQLSQQLDAVYGIDAVLSAEEFRQTTQDIVYTISDIITEIEKNPEAALKYNSTVNVDNLRGASRQEILAQTGVQSIVEYIKANYFGEGNPNIDSFEALDRANLIADNIQAFLIKGEALFIQLEGFGGIKDGKPTTNINTEISETDLNAEQDADNIEELGSSVNEQYGKDKRTENAFDKASVLVKQALTQCYQLNPDGTPVISANGIRQRMDGREALQSIIKWTQGSLSLSSMITKLEAQAEKNKWVRPIIDRLKDTSGKESTFQSQFFGVVSKYFQLYGVGKKSDGKYTVFEVNTHPALSEAKRGILGQYNAGVHPLFEANGKVNTTALEQLKSLKESLDKLKYSEETAEEISQFLSSVSALLGYYTSPEAIAKVLNASTYAQMTSKSLQFIVKSLEENKDNTSWQPFSGKKADNGIINNIGNFITPITEQMEDTINSSFYDSGNMYQSFVTPSYVTKLVQKITNSTREEFTAFMQNEYGKFAQFKDANGNWRNSWLEILDTVDGARELFSHKVQLNFDGNKYMVNRGGAKAMSDAELTISIIAEYFKDVKYGDVKAGERVLSWFRIPLMSNKPSSEFIKFYSYRGPNYKNRVLNGCMKLFGQEISRIQTVKERLKVFKDGSPELISNLDGKRGLQFCFFDFLNKSESSRFKDLVDKVTDNEATDAEKQELADLARKEIEKGIQEEWSKQLEEWRNNGVLEASKNIEGMNETSIEAALENFFWNDFLAANNILNLTVTDLAYYKNTEDVQKRLAQLHAPGIRANVEATDFNGNRVADSKTRTVYLKDVIVNPETLKSNIIENVRVVFDRKLEELKGTPQYETAKAFYQSIIDSFEDGINVADAQGYNSPTSYRKKALMFGKWDAHSEEIYQKLMSDKYTYTDLQVAFQPLKPFVYSQTEKSSGVDTASLPTLKVGVQNKNSEYLLMLANAITQNEDTGKPNYLRAIYEIMEESHKGTTDKNGNHIPRVDGIDTVQFESTVKAGLTGRIDITQANSTEEAKRLLEDLIYKQRDYAEEEYANLTEEQIEANRKEDIAKHLYDNIFVHELNFEDYSIQQEVPEHFKDHAQQQGSQTRMIMVSDLNPNKSYFVEGRELSAEKFRQEYEETIAQNIEDSINDIRSDFALDSKSTTDKNAALAKLLQDEILSSPRYGLDLLMSCMLDSNGKFVLPLGDPIQSKRIEQLINSVIKNRINKQKIAGGPIVQVSNFGTSKQLNIRFKGKDGKPLASLNDFIAMGKSEAEWKDYVKENQTGIAYYEAFVPSYTQDLFRDFMDSEGNIDIEAIETTDPDLLKLVGYRIPTEDKYSIAPIKIVGFMPKEAGDGIMLPYEITLITGSDFDVDKFYIMRKEIPLTLNKRNDIAQQLKQKLGKSEWNNINIFLDQISNPAQRDAAKANFPEIWKEYTKVAYKSKPYTEGRQYRNNKIVDMTWEVLTHEDTADRVLNPGGFEEQKKEGYLVQAARITGKPIFELESLSVKQLKDMCATDKNISFIGTHTQFYKQNAAASSILAIFAVAKVAHACLESNGFQVSVQDVCGIESLVSIMGLTLFDKVTLDAQKDIEGNFIGKTLGSLVASAADAVKDPVLNLMNINSDTVNVLNTLIRMGLPFRKASRLLSTQVVSDLLTKYNAAKLSNYTSFNNVLNKMLQEISEKYEGLAESSILTEDLTDEEVHNAILKRDDKVDFKILLAIQRVLQINNAMSSLNFATRLNSISSAVGPLIIDNLKIEHNLENFNDGIYLNGEKVEDFDAVFNLHPILKQFSRGAEIAKELLGNHFPTNSTQFRNLLGVLDGTNLLNTFYRDRKVFSKFNDFYQSYLLVANGVISSEADVVKHYLKDFPAEFAKNKYKEIYAGNPFIDVIRFDTDSNNNPTIKINTTGMDQETKSRLSSGWLDLYKSGEEGKKLAAELFYYCFYKGGIGFNPQTFMNLLPVQLKTRIKGYKETFEKLPFVNSEDFIAQFVRNNWNDNKIVPYRKFEKPLQIHQGDYVAFYGEEASKIGNLYAFKTKVGKETLLFIRESYDSEKEQAVFKQAIPLGNNGEFMEITSFNNYTSFEEVPSTPKVREQIGEQTEDVATTESFEDTYDDTEVASFTSEFDTRNQVEKFVDSYFNTEQQEILTQLAKEKRFQAMRDIINQTMSENDVEVNQKEVDDIANQFC